MPPLKLEVFKTDPPGGAADSAETAAQEEMRLAAYDQGYGAGWDDSAATQADEQRRERSHHRAEGQVLEHPQEAPFGGQALQPDGQAKQHGRPPYRRLPAPPVPSS